MEDAASLEAYLRGADIDLYGHFQATAGGGHPDKELVVIRGGIGALAKLARNEQELSQCRSEVAAYKVADALGWGDLVPVTVFREVPSADGLVEASVQILWPAFSTAQELGITESAVEDRDALRAAILDSLLLNSDRNAGNWGMVANAKLGLIDHGHTAISKLAGVSGFAQIRSGEDIREEDAQRLSGLTERGADALVPGMEHDDAVAIVERANAMLEHGVI